MRTLPSLRTCSSESLETSPTSDTSLCLLSLRTFSLSQRRPLDQTLVTRLLSLSLKLHALLVLLLDVSLMLLFLLLSSLVVVRCREVLIDSESADIDYEPVGLWPTVKADRFGKGSMRHCDAATCTATLVFRGPCLLSIKRRSLIWYAGTAVAWQTSIWANPGTASLSLDGAFLRLDHTAATADRSVRRREHVFRSLFARFCRSSARRDCRRARSRCRAYSGHISGSRISQRKGLHRCACSSTSDGPLMMLRCGWVLHRGLPVISLRPASSALNAMQVPDDAPISSSRPLSSASSKPVSSTSRSFTTVRPGSASPSSRPSFTYTVSSASSSSTTPRAAMISLIPLETSAAPSSLPAPRRASPNPAQVACVQAY